MPDTLNLILPAFLPREAPPSDIVFHTWAARGSVPDSNADFTGRTNTVQASGASLENIPSEFLSGELSATAFSRISEVRRSLIVDAGGVTFSSLPSGVTAGAMFRVVRSSNGQTADYNFSITSSDTSADGWTRTVPSAFGTRFGPFAAIAFGAYFRRSLPNLYTHIGGVGYARNRNNNTEFFFRGPSQTVPSQFLTSHASDDIRFARISRDGREVLIQSEIQSGDITNGTSLRLTIVGIGNGRSFSLESKRDEFSSVVLTGTRFMRFSISDPGIISQASSFATAFTATTLRNLSPSQMCSLTLEFIR